MQNPLGNLLQKDMDRREFLTHVGAGILAVAGISSIMRALERQGGGGSAAGGYGGGSYGGSAEPTAPNLQR